MNRTLRSALAAAATLAAVGTGLAVAAPAVASDAPPGSFEIDYDVNGTSKIVKPNSTITLGPSVIKTFIKDDGSGTFTASLPLPPTKATFAVLGLVPVSATVNFVPAGPVTGTISQEPPVRLTATAKYTIKLTNVVAGGAPVTVGDACQTAQPVSIPVATPAGQAFDIEAGGTLTGTYTIGNFANCGLTTTLINLLVPGPGNTATLRLSNGRFIP